MHADRSVTTGVQNPLEVVLGYWSKNSKLLLARVQFCHQESCHLGESPGQEYDNDDMPIFMKHFCLGTSKHNSAQTDKIRCMALYMNSPGSIFIIVTTVTRNKLLWILIAAGLSTVHRRWKSLNTNARCVRTNRQKKMVYPPK